MAFHLRSTEVESYAFDPEGNRLVTRISPAYVTDDADQILDDGDNTHVWNAHGALISKTPKNASIPAPAGERSGAITTDRT